MHNSSSTYILTICISMVLKRRHRGLSLDIGSRLAGSGLGGEGRPPDKNFQSPVWGSSSTSGGLNPPPPTNRTLVPAHQALRDHVDLSLGRLPGWNWKRRPGRPNNRWIDQVRNNTGNIPSTLWRSAILRGHGSGVTQRPSLVTRTCVSASKDY